MPTPRGYPFPILADAPNVPSHFQALAAAIDSDVGTVAAGMATTAGGLGCIVVNSAQQTIATGTSGIALGYDTELWDPSNLFSSGQPTRITTPGSGTQVWAVSAHFEIAGNATGIRQIFFRVNGVVDEWFAVRDVLALAGANSKVSSAGEVTLTGGNYIEAIAVQNSGGSLLTVAGRSRFGAFRIA